MKKIFIAILAVSSMLFTQCTKPTEGFTISINPDVFDNVVAVKFYDAATPGVAPSGIRLTISGDQAQSIYEISGHKIFNVVDGVISLGLLPAAAPAEGQPALFVINAEADGYLPVRVPVTILAGQATKLVTISMVNLNNPPPGVTVVQQNTTLTGNAVPATETIATPTTKSPVATTVSLPANTRFNDAAGNAISGSTLKTTIAHFNTLEAASLNAFPGSGFHSDDITDETGNRVSGNFRTAGFCNIDMALDGKAVKTFSQPVNVKIDVRNDQVNPRTGAAFAAGDVIPVWSYQIETGKWAFEKNGTIVSNGGKLEVDFTTTHLTYYNLAFLDNVCLEARATIVTGLPSAESFLVDIFPEGETAIPAIAGAIMQVENNGVAAFENVPQGNVTMKVYRNTANNSQTDWKVREATPLAVYTGALCGNQPTITLNMPSLTSILFDIEGRCPSNSANPYVRPSVDVWYRIKNIGEYQLLGHVNQGKFQTTNINFQSTYDFKVIWGGSRVYLRTKYVDSTSYTRTITVPENEQQHFCN
ncbi:hypothetical protein [Taibaiella koreensis]|uniref:hypothetical protein n=1 Tax=Taibaiella koreensis TaxID=1268548 RepID=UPI000E59B6F9|nr:hypothetical protein [Taibaiella koreensis]